MSTSAFFWNAAGLFLIFLWVFQRMLFGGRRFIFAVLGAAALSLVPFFGHVPRYWLSGMTPNISVPLIVVLLASIASCAGWGTWFRSREWRAAWIFGAIASLVLYPSAMGLGLSNFDSYSLGWPWLEWNRSLLLFGGVAVTAGFLVWRGNRFGWVLVLAAVVYLLRIQESWNFWEGLLDPLYGVASLCGVMVLIVRGSVRR